MFARPAQRVDMHHALHRPTATVRPHAPVQHQAAGQQTAAASPLLLHASRPTSQAAPTSGKRRRSSAGKPKKPWTWQRITKWSSLAAACLVLLCGSWVGWKLYRNASKITHNNNPFHLLSVFKPVPLKSQDGRVNVLVAGDSADRNDGGGGGDLTDSIMVLSIDTKNHNAFMLSIPRDLWVNIPGMGHSKINAANTNTSFGASGLPSGGMGQLQQVVQQNLGITIDYYALVNYTAFKDTVNATGGITVNIQSPDPRGLYDPSPAPGSGTPLLKLANGPQNLNGDTALALARARGDNYRAYGFPASDFDRTEHQRQMLLALKTKATTAGVLTDPLKVGKLADAIGNNVHTDMQLNEVESLYSLTKGINNNNIQSFNIKDLVSGKNLLMNYSTPTGQSALIPAAGIDDFGDIQAAIKKLLSSDPVIKEGANVVVLNGGNTAGLARTEGDTLAARGMNVAAVGSASKQYDTTTIVDLSKGKMPGTKQALQKLYGNNVVASDPEAANYNADFVIILGVNQRATGSASGQSQSASAQQ